MIARLEGRLRERTPTRVVVDVNGVGYDLHVPLSTFDRLPDEGKTVALHVYTHVREGAIQLFGFHTTRERVLFELLLRASGVGPKLAQAILSGIAPEDLVAALRTGDVAALRAVPGVGQKTAERLLVELRDRAVEALGEPERGARPADAPGAGGDSAVQQVASALVNLGTAAARASQAAEAAVRGLGEDAPVEALVRAALRRLAR